MRVSDEAVVSRWVENPYYQHFCGEVFFQHCKSVGSSSLTNWRKRIGEEGVDWLLTKTIEAGIAAGLIDKRSAEQVIVDTTVMEKDIAHPADARLYERARERLVKLAQEAGLDLRQGYARLVPRLAAPVGRYAHARQFKRMRKGLRRLKGYAGRVMRDIGRKLDCIDDDGLRNRVSAEITLVGRLLRQKLKDKGKLYALHEPNVDCISKGKDRHAQKGRRGSGPAAVAFGNQGALQELGKALFGVGDIGQLELFAGCLDAVRVQAHAE